MVDLFKWLVGLFFESSLSAADVFAILLISSLGGWYWLLLIVWFPFSVYMESITK